MAKLILSYNGDVIKEYELDRGSLTVGRDEKNDIHIDNPAVSSKHAKILTILNESFIEDLDSTNGTYIDGNRITGHPLKHGECIFIGEHELNYVNDATINDDRITEDDTNSARNDSEQSENKPADNEDTTANEPGPAKLQILSDTYPPKELPLTKIINTLGRADTQVAAVIRRPTGYYLIVIDAGKENKMPLVNGAAVDKQELLIDGDIIRVADVQMRFQLI